MTNTVKVAAALVTASKENRSARYKVLPWDELGHPSGGPLTVPRGSVRIPKGRVIFNFEHQGARGEIARPIGWMENFSDEVDGLYADAVYAETTLASDTLEEAYAGLRTGASVELINVTKRGNTLVSADLDAVAAVYTPAFDSARLVASDFSDVEELPEEEETQDSSAAAEDQSTEEVDDNEEKESNIMENTAVPSGLQAADNSAAAPELNAKTIAQAFSTRDNRLAASLVEPQENALQAAFAGTTYSTNKTNIDPGQWVGELWSGKTYNRKYAELVTPGTLTSWKVEGWKWVNRPTVADWDGDLEEIHSSVATTEPYSVNAQFLAGGYKVSREYVDLGSPEFVEGLYQAAANDYARKSDIKVLSAISSAATVVTGGTVPSGVNPTIARIVDGALAIIEVGTPSFALVSSDLYRNALLTRNDDSLKYLSSALGFEEGSVGGFRLIPAPELPANTVIVGAREALQFFETAGTPIRVSALDVQHGAIDEAVHGYYAVVVHDERGLVKVV